MSASMPWLDRLAHDLRGPLTPLQTAAYLLKSGQLEPARQQELFEMIERQTKRLGRMIDEVSDWSRASQGRLLGAQDSYEPAMLLDFAVSSVVPGRRVLPVITDDSGEGRVHGDQLRLVQLLRTLVEYAAARTGGRPPTLHLWRDADALRIDVTDDAATPDPAQLATLLDAPMPEPYDEGLGLRLLIARAIAEAHGGALAAEVAPEGGMQLRCTLPLA